MTAFNDEVNPCCEANFLFEYQMLSRLQSDLDYYLGAGGRSERVLFHKNIQEHFADMKKRLEAFPDGLKPQWLTATDMDNYERAINAEQ